MKDATGFTIFDRLKIASDSATDAELAVNLKLTKQAIAQARAKKVAPASWIPKAAELFNVSTDWLFYGRSPMRPTDTPQTPKTQAEMPTLRHEVVVSCARCNELKAELELEKAERRELNAENRELNAENRRLLSENGDLRERCAKFEERLACGNSGQ